MDFSLMFFMASVLAGEERILVVTSQSYLFGSQELPSQSFPWGCALWGACPSWSNTSQVGHVLGPGGKAEPMASGPDAIPAEMVVWLSALSWPVHCCLLHSGLCKRPSAAL